MDAKEHLYYGLGIIAYTIAKADGEIQGSEKNEFREIIVEWSDQYGGSFDITGIIFNVLDKNKPDLKQGFEDGMKYIKLGSNHLTEQMKEQFVYLIQDVAHAFPPVTLEESEVIDKFRNALAGLH